MAPSDAEQATTNAAASILDADRTPGSEPAVTDSEAAFPAAIEPLTTLAWQHFHQCDWPKAAQAFSVLRDQFPDNPTGYLGGARVWKEQGDLPRAEGLLTHGMATVPDAPELMLEYAHLPITPYLREARNWPEAIKRFETLCLRFPRFETGRIHAAQTLHDAGQPAEADSLLAEAKRDFPASGAIALAHARQPAAQSDWLVAAERFADLCKTFPAMPEARAGLADTLARLARFDEAEAVLDAAMADFPANLDVLVQQAQLATLRNDLQAAFDRWRDIQQRFPNVDWVARRVFEAQLRLAEVAPSVPTEPDASIPRPGQNTEHLSDYEMILNFESLGGTHLGCEFGLVQRSLGAEPLGLLRWTDMRAADIIEALEARFEGVGSPDQTELLVPEKDGQAEYTSRDRRFNMRMHTFVARDDAPADRFHRQLCRRLVFLKEKLVESLQNDSKIFVFKLTTTNLTPDELAKFRSAMRQYGTNTLLYVRYADASHPAGTVEIADRGLMIGYLERFAMGPSEETLGAVNEDWICICRKAHQLWRSGAVAAACPVDPANRASAGSDPDWQLDAAPAMKAAASALEAGDMSAAQAQWRLARSAINAPPEAWIKAAEHSGDAAGGCSSDALIAEVSERFPNNPAVSHDLARLYERQSNWPLAEKYWRRFVAQAPTLWWAYAALASALRAQARNDEADAILAEGVKALPDDPLMLAEIARMAGLRGDLQVAMRGWEAVVARFPDRWIGLRGKAELLRQSSQPERGDELVSIFAPRFTHDPDAQHDVARLAERRRDWPTAENAWRTFIGLGGKHPWAYLDLARALAEQSRYLEAEDILQEAAGMYPDDADIPARAALYAEARGDIPLATQHWRTLGALRPKSADGPLGQAGTLRRNGLITAADDVIAAAIQHLPDEPKLLDAYALNATAREDWTEALRRLETAQNRFPSSDAIRQRITEVKQKMAVAGVIADGPAPEDERAAENRALVMRFESLGGGGHGCEFGIFQRHYGAEPLGLLRWADVFQDQLSEALETEFAGVGDPEFTNIFIPGNNSDEEYWTTDTRYHMAMRSFVRAADMPLERMRQQVAKRMMFLRHKLMDDLRSVEKIFVYKNMKRNLTDAELKRLHSACRRYGNNILFYIRYENAENPCGTVTLHPDGLMIGYIDHFSHSAETDDYLGSANEMLLDLCKTALMVLENNGITTEQTYGQDTFLFEGAPLQAPASVLPEQARVHDAVSASYDETAGSPLDVAIRQEFEHFKPDPTPAPISLESASAEPSYSSKVSQIPHEETENILAAALSDTLDSAQSGEMAAPGTTLPADLGGTVHRLLNTASALVSSLKFEEADTILAQIIESTQDFAAFELYAMSASYRHNWDMAVERWRMAMLAFPDRGLPAVALAGVLQATGHFDEAETVLLEAMNRLPGDPEIARDYAKIPLARGQVEEALVRLAIVRERFPDSVDGFATGAEAFRMAGRFDEAEAILESVRDRFETNFHFLFQSAKNASSLGQWGIAFERWNAILSIYPDVRDVSGAIGDTIMLWYLAKSEGDPEARAATLPDEIARRAGAFAPSQDGTVTSALSSRDLFMKFEGLGDRCEFGLVQRHFGAEPIGLLRWSGIEPAQLIAALECRFDGVGLPENTFVHLNPHSNEYFAGDNRFFFMHTFIKKNEGDEAALFEKFTKRLAYLKRKLLDDLASGEKIFIYKAHSAPLSDVDADRISAVLAKNFPASRIVLMRTTKDSGLVGGIAPLVGNAVFGFVSRFSDDLDDRFFKFDEWEAACRAALRYFAMRA